MPKKTKSIPVNPLAEEFDAGIAVGKISSGNLDSFDEAGHSHRHDYHIFLLAQKGSAAIEIDFETHNIMAPSILYVHPNQVHRILQIEKGDFYLLAMRNESINQEYLQSLEQNITPAQPLLLTPDVFSIFNQTITLCETMFERKNNKLYTSLLKDYCNAFVGLMVSQYLEQTTSTTHLSRFDMVTKAFKLALERDFNSIRSPSAYASALNISTPYLNECVRNATGFPVSYHIQQRIVLEAKRLLFHSDKSVKEIANELNYDDYAYFSRLFSKVAGMTAIAFRNKNLD